MPSLGTDECDGLLEAYLGSHLKIVAGYASDPADRQRVASGGMATALLRTVLLENVADGVAVARADFSKGNLGYRVDVVTDPESLSVYATSAYFDIPVQRHWRELNRFEGRLAVCALPCHFRMLEHISSHGMGLENVVFRLSLFCGHNNKADLVRFVLGRAGIEEADVRDMWFDRTYLGGSVRITRRDGTETAIPFRHFNVYRSLWFFSKPMCRYCSEHLGCLADVSVGDLFTSTYRNHPVKHSVALARTETGLDILRRTMERKAITAETVDAQTVFQSQRRVLVPSADLGSRSLACRVTGFGGKRFGKGRFRLRSFFSYWLLLTCDRLSRSHRASTIIGAIPRPLLYACIAFVKLNNQSLKPRHD